jgi:hypothetical protein
MLVSMLHDRSPDAFADMGGGHNHLSADLTPRPVTIRARKGH